MFYRAVAATCPGNDKEYNSNNIYLNTKYITDEIKASEVLLKQKKEQEGLQFYGIAEGFGADRYTDEASLIAVRKLLSIQKRASGNEISDNYDEAADSLYAYLEDFIKEANEAVAAKATELSERKTHGKIYINHCSGRLFSVFCVIPLFCLFGNSRARTRPDDECGGQYAGRGNAGGGNPSRRANAGTRTDQPGRAYAAGLRAAYGRTDRAAGHAYASAGHRVPNAGSDAVANAADYRRTDANPGAAVFI